MYKGRVSITGGEMTVKSKSIKLLAATALTSVAGSIAMADPNWNGLYVGQSFNTFPIDISFVADGTPTKNAFEGVVGSVFAAALVCNGR